MNSQGKAGEKGAAQYDRAAAEFARSGKGKKAAEDAEHALDSEEGKRMRDAESRGRAPARK